MQASVITRTRPLLVILQRIVVHRIDNSMLTGLLIRTLAYLYAPCEKGARYLVD